MSDRRADDTSIAPRRSLAGSPDAEGPVLPPMPDSAGKDGPERDKGSRRASRWGRNQRDEHPQSEPKDDPKESRKHDRASTSSSAPGHARGPAASGSGPLEASMSGGGPATTSTIPRATGPARPRQPRQARLRITQVDPWSVTKTAFLLSIALGVVTVVAVAVVWTVLGAAGLWDSIDSAVQETIGDSSGSPFQIESYLGTSRVLGFSMIVAVVDVVLITMIATLGAFLYNLAATLLGGVEVTLAEDD